MPIPLCVCAVCDAPVPVIACFDWEHGLTCPACVDAEQRAARADNFNFLPN